MKLSKKTRYAFRALVDLASSRDPHTCLATIAERNGISQQFLEHVFAALKRAEVIKSVKGKQGGYRLGREASQITAADIVSAIEGDFAFEAEEITPENRNYEISETIQEQIIDRVNREMRNILENITLADLVSSYQDKTDFAQGMYYI